MPPKKEKTSSPDYPSLARSVVEASGNGDACKLQPGLYLAATPIGNMGDITLRALAVLAQADVILCEDTRTSGLLLNAYGIQRPMLSYHDHNADERRPEVLERLRAGKAVALISDAGMPAIADPGFKLVRACRDEGIPVTALPGANAAITALAASGLATDQFTFLGFLPPKSAARKKSVAPFAAAPATLVIYESPQRLADCLADLRDALGGERPSVVTRELTKLYEEVRGGTLGELAAHYATHEIKGEIVILVGKGVERQSFDIDALLRERLKQLSVRDAVAEVAEMTGTSKKEVYARALELAEGHT